MFFLKHFFMRRHYKGISINTSKNTHEVIFSLIRNDSTAKIADIPAGSGAFVKRLKDAKYEKIFAIDIQNILEFEHDNFIQADMTKELPIPNCNLDIVVCIDGIEHINNHFFFVNEVNRILKPGGEFIISTPNISSLRSRWKWFTTGHHHKCNSPLDENNPSPLHHIGMISYPEIRYLLHTSGFTITNIKTNRIKPINWAFLFFLPLVFLSTAWTYYKTGTKHKLRELNKSVFRKMFSKDILFGETLIVKARKKMLHNQKTKANEISVKLQPE